MFRTQQRSIVPVGSRVILAVSREWFVDEFATLETELKLDSGTVDLEELVLDIEGSIVEADLFSSEMFTLSNHNLSTPCL